MTALAANRTRDTYDRHLAKRGEPITGVDSEEFYQGAIVCHNGAGKIAVGADTAGFRVAGITPKRVTTGASNTTKIEYELGHVEKLDNSGNVTASHTGQSCYLVDDQTVGILSDTTEGIVVGRIEEVPSDGVLVWIGVPGVEASVDDCEYVPTLTDVTNVAASVLVDARYVRIGRTVIVLFAVTIDATGTGATELGISLPVASALAAAGDLVGSATSGTASEHGAQLSADTSNDRASLTYTAVGTGVVDWQGSFSYQLL